MKRLAQLLFQAAQGRLIVSVQNPIYLGKYAEVQPDLALLRAQPDFYAAALPAPADVFLVVEVGDTTAEYDRQVKLPLYALAGIPEVWLVDLNAQALEVYRSPVPEGYGQRLLPRRDEVLSLPDLPDVALKVRDILA